MESLKEMANLRNSFTGVSHGTIYISSKEGNHGPRVKYFRGKPGKSFPTASFTISENPKVVEDSIKLTALEIKEVSLFVRINKETLLQLWRNGAYLYKEDWNALVDSLKAIR